MLTQPSCNVTRPPPPRRSERSLQCVVFVVLQRLEINNNECNEHLHTKLSGQKQVGGGGMLLCDPLQFPTSLQRMKIRWGGGKDGGVEFRVNWAATGGHIDVSGLCGMPSEVMVMSGFMLPTRAVSVLMCVARADLSGLPCSMKPW